MPSYYYHLKFELYATPYPAITQAQTPAEDSDDIYGVSDDDGNDESKSKRKRGEKGSHTSRETPAQNDNDSDITPIWIPAPGGSIFDDLPSHPRRSSNSAAAANAFAYRPHREYLGEDSNNKP